MIRLAMTFLALTLASQQVVAQTWKPGEAPLLTPWAERVSPERVLPEYPRPQMLRGNWLNLNGLWEYAVVSREAAKPQAYAGHILVPFPIESALSGVTRRVGPGERVWYRRMLRIPDALKGQRILLHFGAVDWEAEVFVNGKPIGSHRGGYDPFSLDITEALKSDGSEQEILVAVWDPTDRGPQPRGKQVTRPGGIYYTPTTGIWQTVWLEAVPKTHIEDLHIDPDSVARQVRITVRTAGAEQGAEVVAHLTERPVFEPEASADQMGALLATGRGKAGETLTLTVPADRFEPWSPESPRLYGLRIELRTADGATDTVRSYCGFRKIEVKADDRGITRLFLNGKPYFQIGVLDQGFWPDGLYTAPTDEALRFDIEATKKLGFNMSRKHVKVEPARWYHWCDRLGLLVWQDMPSGDRSVAPGRGEITRTKESAEQFELELKRMLDSLRHFPCIVMWVVFNEGWGQYDTVRLTKWVKEYDPTRLVNCASGWNDMRVGDVHDIHVYPGPGSPKPEPSRAAVLGEFGGLGLGVDGHTWSKQTWGYRGTASKEDLTFKYERLLQRVYALRDDPGLSAAVYTQITDVETEANGLLTYDRKVVKVDERRVAAVNRGDVSHVPQTQVVIPTSQEKGQTWRYTFNRPDADWFQPGFDDSAWRSGEGGFGTAMTPGSVVRTEWNTSDIWIRRKADADLKTDPDLELVGYYLLVHHDEDAEIYLNGVKVAELKSYVTDYVEVPLDPKHVALLKPSGNVLAVHCRQTGGGQYIDAGLIRLVRPKAK